MTTDANNARETRPVSAPIECDVLVVGGGPAGSTAATLLARRGWSVAMVERDRHPRFHIGESLLPMNLPIFERLGVMDRVNAIGVRKPGADFPAATPKGYNVFRFERALNGTPAYAYQVRRQDLDQLLFENAAAAGARTFEATRVTTVEFGDRVRAQAEGPDGAAVEFRARYLVDASGRDTLLGNRLRLKRKHGKHQSAAIFAHFRGVEPRTGEDEGNISVYRLAQGWVWMIPLPDGLMSIGAVCSPEFLKQRRGPNDEFLLQTLRGIPEAAGRMQNARIVGNLHVTGNYSYECTAMAGRRWIMAGDAYYAFLDPIFSSGVYFAMNSAELASEVVDAALHDPGTEGAGQQRYEAQVRRGLKTFSWFIFRFTSPAMRYLFANPRNNWRLEEAMISMLSGDVFRTSGVGWRLGLFKVFYYVTSCKFLARSIRDAWLRRRQVHAVFAGGTTSQDPA